VVEGGGLENRCPVLSGTVGSNPTPSATKFKVVKFQEWVVTFGFYREGFTLIYCHRPKANSKL
jgi:hypothetical protein